MVGLPHWSESSLLRLYHVVDVEDEGLPDSGYRIDGDEIVKLLWTV